VAVADENDDEEEEEDEDPCDSDPEAEVAAAVGAGPLPALAESLLESLLAAVVSRSVVLSLPPTPVVSNGSTLLLVFED